MFYSGGTPELFACNKINRKEKDRRILNTKITFVNQVCKGTGAGYIYINPPDTNNDYYLIGATNADWNACPVSIVAVSRQNSTHIVHFTGNIENGKSVRILSMWTQAKYITFKS